MRSFVHVNELNEVMNCKKSVTENIVPGMGATMFCGSDRYAMVVVEVVSPKKIKVAYADDFEEKFVTDENGVHMLPEEFLSELKELGDYHVNAGHSRGFLHTYTYRKNGRWMPAGHGMWETCSIHVGKAESYRDLSF